FKQTFCDLYEQEEPSCSCHSSQMRSEQCVVSSGSPIPIGSHALYHSHMTIGSIDDESI
ncbi:hypothetical protein PENNAL_c0504G04466, partial [Penicillium nalgiovense]